LRIRAPGALACAYSASSATSIEFELLNLHPDEPAGPVHT